MKNSDKIIDGKRFAEDLIRKIADESEEFFHKKGCSPGLAVVLVGEDPASKVYVSTKIKKAKQAGIVSFSHLLPSDVSEDKILSLISELNEDDRVHGILVQLPLPAGIDERKITAAIDPRKDVDGFHPSNIGLLSQGNATLVPCTPLGCLLLLKDKFGDLSGKKAVIVGRSSIVGKPMAALLLNENCTVTVVHSRTKNLREECSQADILVVAVGKPRFIDASLIKPGAVVIDVGINRVQSAQGKKLVGDVDYDEAILVAGAITPVPGGVGPMTVACLMKNTILAAKSITGVA